MKANHKKRLLELIMEKSFKYDDENLFVLASGQKSAYYINCKPTCLSSSGMYLAGKLIYSSIKDIIDELSGVGGLTFGADPIAVATAFTAGLNGKELNAFSVRKELKKHGVINWIEGDLKSGDKVVILEDVVTSGGSTIKAIERARYHGLDVQKVVALIDRQEMNGMANIKNYVKDAEAIFTRDELLSEYHLKKNDK